MLFAGTRQACDLGDPEPYENSSRRKRFRHLSWWAQLFRPCFQCSAIGWVVAPRQTTGQVGEWPSLAEAAKGLEGVCPPHMEKVDTEHLSATPPPQRATPDDTPHRSFVGRFLLRGCPVGEGDKTEKQYPWYVVLWLTGVDYFSTLGYQPGIALLAAGVLAVPATVVLVMVTLLGALPLYAQVARRSYAGQGSIALLENLFSGWKSKIVVLVLLGFAGTDFVITMTLSAADAARHAIANPYLHTYVGNSSIRLTLLLLLLLAVVFLAGFRDAIRLAQAVAIPYLALNAVVLLRAMWEVFIHPQTPQHWWLRLSSFGDWTSLFVVSALAFPQLALGLSGFETGVSVMPLIAGTQTDLPGLPSERIRPTRALLITAGLIMSCLLLSSSLVTSLLIPEADYRSGGSASGRALAYLAHRLLGNIFGTVYDLSTMLILWFAGASAMTGLLNLIPRYLPRFGMAPRWLIYARPLILMLFAINVIVTFAFRADVEAQSGAYATGVLVLMLSAAVAVTLALWSETSVRYPQNALAALYFLGVTIVFAYSLAMNVIQRPDGIVIASIFITLLLGASAISRYLRSTEMRVSQVTFADPQSEELWMAIVGKKVNLVPHAISTEAYRGRIAAKVRNYIKIEGPLAFIHVNLVDNRSDFLAQLSVRVYHEADHLVIEAHGAVAVANSIAYLSELLDPVSIVLGLTRRNPMKQALKYLLWGEGETGLMFYSILVGTWEKTKRTVGLPLIFLVSE